MSTPIKTFGTSGYAIDKLLLFQDVKERDVQILLKDCPVIHIAAGQPVSNSDKGAARLYIVLRGALSSEPPDAIAKSSDGHTIKILAGESVGELSILDDETDSIPLYAFQDSDVLIIEADKLWQLINESNGVARNLLKSLSFQLRAANVQIRRRQKLGEFYRQLSMADGLTGLQNRAWLNHNLPELVNQAHASDHPLSIIMIDIDHFKKFNDEHGHLCGDNALQIASDVLTTALRPSDFAARFGGEELMVILPYADKKNAVMVAQRLCERMQQSIVFSDMRTPLPHITASFGVATISQHQTADDLIATADKSLYRAKENGRNQVAF